MRRTAWQCVTLSSLVGVVASVAVAVPAQASSYQAGGAGATRVNMRAHYATPMPVPHSGVGVYTPPSGPSISTRAHPSTSSLAASNAKEGWTTFSHWTRGPGGKVTTDLYPRPEFHQTSSGWKRIDPSVTPGDHGKLAGSEGTIRPIRFGGSASDLAEIELGSGPVTLSAPGLSVASTKVRGNGVTYSDVAPDADLSYTVSNEDLADSIVLNGPAAPTSYTFHLSDPKHQLGTLVDNNDGSYSFSNVLEGDVRVGLAAPKAYMDSPAVEQVGSAPGSADQSVTPSGNGYDVTESVNSLWLVGKNYPIVLDPTVTFSDSNGSMYAGGILTDNNSTDSSDNPNYSCYGGGCGLAPPYGDYDLGAGSVAQPTYEADYVRSLFQFDLSSIPADSSVSSASMNMYTAGCLGAPNGGQGPYYYCNSYNYTLDLDQVTQSWDKNTLTWNGLNAIYGSAVSSISQPAFLITTFNPCTQCFWETFPVASEVQSWVNGAPNYGFMARNESEGNNSTSGPGWAYLGVFGSAPPNGYGDPHPYLSVTYDPAPSAPSSVTASAGNGSANLSWGASSTNGGSAISSYSVQTYQNGSYTGQSTTVCGTCTSTTIGGLTNGLPYSFNVYATNADGLPGPGAMSNTVTPQTVPQLTKTVSNLDSPGAQLASRGQSLEYIVTVTNPQSGPMSVSVSDPLPSGLALSPTPALSCPAQNGALCSASGNTVSLSGLSLPANQSYTFSFGAVAVGSNRGCATVTNTSTATNTSSGGATSASASFPICDSGLGIEPWWSYLTKTLGSDQTAQLNAANGNLVVRATDSTPITAHGKLGFVLQRTYNSEDTGLLNLPGGIGKGWTLNVAQGSDLASLGITSTGLEIPSNLETVANPESVTLIDGSGGHLVFTPRSINISAGAINVTSSLSGALSDLVPRVLATASGYTNLCVEQAYTAPAGVHLSLWRYYEVDSTSSSPCTDLSGSSGEQPLVLGYAAIRPDRLRYEFNALGQLIDLTDGNGVDLRYGYSQPVGGQLSSIYETDCNPAVQINCKAYHFTYSEGPNSSHTVVVKDPAARSTTYQLDSTDQYLLSVNNPDGTTESYTYQGISSATCGAASGQLCSVTDLRGTKTSFSYSAATLALAPALVTGITDRLATSTSISYAADGSSTTATEGNQITTDKSIDTTGRVGEIQEADTSSNLYHDTFYTWDAPGATCSQPDAFVDNNLCAEKKVAFNDTETGKSNGITTPDELTSYTYNDEGQLLDKRQQSGSSAIDTTYGYNAQYVEATGSTATATDTVAGSGSVSSQARPGTGGSPGNGEDQNTLFVISDKTQSLAGNGNAAGSGYSGYLTSYKVEDSTGQSPNPSLLATATPCSEIVRNGSSTPSYNTGDTCEADAPVGSDTNYVYDNFGDKTQMENGNGNLYSYAYYPDSTTDVSGTTSAGGWLKAVTDPTGNFVVDAYDAAGDVVYTWDRNATSRNAQNGFVGVNAYPGTATSCGGAALPPGYSETQYGPYSGASGSWCAAPWRYKLVTIDAAHADLTGSNPAQGESTYTVDQNGNVTVTRPPRGNAAGNASFDTTQSFNAADELTSTTDPLGDKTSYGYDAFGNKTSMTDPRGNVTTYSYDAVDRLVSTQFTRGPWPSGGAGVPPSCRESTSSDSPIAAGRILCSTTKAYDGVDNVVAAQDANRQTTATHYDAVHRATDVCAPANSASGTSTGVCANAPYSATTPSIHSAKVYDADGNVIDGCDPREFTDGGQTSCPSAPAYGTQSTYDALDRLTSQSVGRASGTNETTTYGYDPDGNETSMTPPNGQPGRPDAPADTTTYAYNALDEKVEMTVPRDATDADSTFWTYDPSGDVTSETQPSSSLSLGTGANGALVVDGTTATSSTNRACPQSNPCQFPSDFTSGAQGDNYSSVTLQNGAWVTVASYNGSSGGSLTWFSTGPMTICSSCGIALNGVGPAGGLASTSVLNGTGASGSGDGGGGGGSGGTYGGAGGGGGHANAGSGGAQGSLGSSPGGGGAAYGSLAGGGQSGVAAMGSGGGGGGYGSSGGGLGDTGNGGAGGGAVHLTANSIDDEGTISANGANGANGGSPNGGGGGGGGSGGSVWLTAPSVTLGNLNAVVVGAGSGGTGADSDNGGAGSVGRVRLDAGGVTGPGDCGNTSWTCTQGSSTSSVATVLGRVTAYSYDADNRLVDTVTGADSTNAAQAGTDGDGTKNIRTRLFYDQDGNVVGELLPGAFSNSVSSPDDSFLVRTDYDNADRPVTTFTPRYDSAHPDENLSSTQSTQCPTSPRIAPASIPSVPVYPSGVGICVAQAGYDPSSNLAKQVLPTSNGSDNRYLSYAYSDDNLLSSVQGPNPASPGNQEPIETDAYDANGNQTSATDANGNTTTTSYFPDSSVSQTADQAYTPSGSSTQITHVTSYAYNADGKPTLVTDPTGHTTTTTYTNDDLTASVTDGAGDTTSYAYDGDGNQTSVISPSANAKDSTNPSGTPTTMTYTYDDLVASMTEPVTGSGSVLRQTTYGYDPGGRKTSETVNEVNSQDSVVLAGGTQSFAYNNDDRMARQSGRGGELIQYGYNPAGGETSVSDSTSNITLSASYYLDNLPATVNDGSRATDFTYDGLGQMSAQSENGGSNPYLTTYSYGDAELPNSMTSAAMGSSNNTDTFSYDQAGRPTTDSLGNGDTVSRSFNPDDTLLSQATTNSSSQTVASYGYTYNNNEEITSQSFSGQSGTGGSLLTATYSYSYDAANRLQSFTDQSGTNNVAWDHDGNRTGYGPGVNSSSGACSASSTTSCYTYNADNSIASSTIGTSSYGYSYNAAGDLTTDPCTSYSYDGFDRMTAATGQTATYCPAPQNASYTYDGLDRQAGVTDGTTSANLHYSGFSDSVADETNRTSGYDTVYGLTPDGAKVALTQYGSTANTQFLTDDGQGDISTVTSSSGSVACSARYDAFGSPEGAQGSSNPCDTGSTLDNYFYRGARRDSVTGQYQFGSRTYNPTTDSFMSEDHNRTAQPNQSATTHTDPLTENTFTYVNGDPVNFDDPTGYASRCQRHCPRKSAHKSVSRRSSATPAPDQFWPNSLPDTLLKGIRNGDLGARLHREDLIARRLERAAFSQQVLDNYMLQASMSPGERQYYHFTQGVVAHQAAIRNGLLAAQTVAGVVTLGASAAADVAMNGLEATEEGASLGDSALSLGVRDSPAMAMSDRTEEIAHQLNGNTAELSATSSDSIAVGVKAEATPVANPGSTSAVEGGGAGETVSLFRAVSPAEAEDIAANGFRAQPEGFSMETKLFTTSPENATQIGRTLYSGPGEAFDVVRADVPQSFADQLYRFSSDAGLPSIAVYPEQLPTLNQISERWLLDALPWWPKP